MARSPLDISATTASSALIVYGVWMLWESSLAEPIDLQLDQRPQSQQRAQPKSQNHSSFDAAVFQGGKLEQVQSNSSSQAPGLKNALLTGTIIASQPSESMAFVRSPLEQQSQVLALGDSFMGGICVEIESKRVIFKDKFGQVVLWLQGEQDDQPVSDSALAQNDLTMSSQEQALLDSDELSLKTKNNGSFSQSFGSKGGKKARLRKKRVERMRSQGMNNP